MKAVIVAKTRMGHGACVGALTFNGRSLRLYPPDKENNERFNQEYEVGSVWELTRYEQPAEIISPHIETIIVHEKRPFPAINDLAAFIEYQMPPQEGDFSSLFEGLTEATPTGALFIAERNGIPPYSTMFWRPDKALMRDSEGKRIRYRYPTADGGRTLTFVGYQEPLPELPAGTLLRVSMSQWWRPSDRPEAEPRCYLQLSGWILPQDNASDWDFEASQVWSEPEPEPAAMLNLPSVTPPPATSPRAILKQIFGYDAFRPLQEDIIDNLLAEQDSLAIMPTGSGKSLCFQLPALLWPGLTVVVSPLISLMQDQVAQLQELGIAAVTLNSSLPYPVYNETISHIRAGRVKLLYVAPETLLRPEMLVLLEQVRVDCLTIDEAHCISEWGHDFRPEYRQLAAVRQRLPDTVCLAVTATATERVRQDIIQSLRINGDGQFLASFDRDNLFLAVEPKTDGLQQTMQFLDAHRGEAGIIYCATRRQVDTLSEQLAAHGWSVLPYHAGLNNGTRQQNQHRFIYEEGLVMVATVAFGMGINKSNVRFILHYDLPKNLESYYQQIGRAGRDGLRADCLLLFSYSDVQTINYFIQQEDPSQQIGSRTRLEAMLAFVETGQCRRRPLLSYFGETYQAESCDFCDNCLAEEQEQADLTIPAQKFLSCVKRTGELFGMTHIIDVLRGSRAKRVLQKGHDRLSTYDIGGEFSKKEWQYLARQFIQQGLLVQDAEYGSLKLTAAAYAVFKGEPVYGLLPERETPTPTTDRLADYDGELFSLLRAKRTELAQETAVPPYIIFSDRALVEMATYFPQSEASFGNMYGVGQAKVEKYAAQFLPIIRDYCAGKGLEEKARVAVASSPARRIAASAGGKSRSEEVVERFNQGQSVAELTAVYNVKQSTIVSHLYKGYQAGLPLRASDELLELVTCTADLRQQALAAFAEHGPDFLRPIFDALEEQVSFEDLHLLRLHTLLQQPRPAATGELVEGKLSMSPDMDLHRIVQLGEARNAKGFEELIAALQDENGNVRRLAASALGKIKDKRAVEPLLELLRVEKKPQVRQYAVKALGKLGDKRAVTTLKQISESEDEKYYTRQSAITALRQLT
jgi:ATP-dependent DNA helicase RecQ